MSRNLAVSALQPAWQRATKLVSFKFSWHNFIVVSIIFAIERPGIDLPYPFDRWLNLSEWHSYSSQMSALSFPHGMRSLMIVTGILIAVALVILLMIFFVRVPFMRFDLISGRRQLTWDLWRDNGSLALQWFLFLICIGIAQQAASGLLGLALRFTHESDIPGLAAAGNFGSIMWGIIGSVIYWLADDFLIPVLSLQGGTIINGIKAAWRMLRLDLAGFFRYIAIKAILVALGTVPLTILVFVELRLLLAPAMRFVIHLLQGSSLEGVTHISFAVVLGLSGAALVFALCMLVWALTAGVISCFFGSYAVLFFAGRYELLDSLLKYESVIPA